MKHSLSAAASLLALVAWDPAARAIPCTTTFTNTGSLVTCTVPETGTYRVLAFGAQGGEGGSDSVIGHPGGMGGLGGAVSGIVVVDVDRGLGQLGAEIGDHLADGRLLVEAGHQHRQALPDAWPPFPRKSCDRLEP